MRITMSMSSYEIEPDSEQDFAQNSLKQNSTEVEYSDDILYAGWNPEVNSISQQLELVPTLEQETMPVAVTTEIVELFLRKMYSYQR
jgi:hypothetical protein